LIHNLNAQLNMNTDKKIISTKIAKLIRLSRTFGADPELVLAGGGNTSIKHGARLFVKASGHALATLTEDGLVELDRRRLARALAINMNQDVQKRESLFTKTILAARIHPEKGQRPSVESVLHSLLDASYVLHFHPTYVNMITACTQGRQLIERDFGSSVIWIPVCDPGLVLASNVKQALDKYIQQTGSPYPPALFLQNHGLFICGSSDWEICRNIDHVISTIRRSHHLSDTKPGKAAAMMPPVRRKAIKQALLNAAAEPGSKPVVLHDSSPLVLNFIEDKANIRAVKAGPLTPDQIVYCRSFPMILEKPLSFTPDNITLTVKKAFAAYKSQYSGKPIIILAKGAGMFVLSDSEKSANTARLLYVDAIKTMLGARRLCGIHPMPAARRIFIETWEAEAYRRQIANMKKV
jgi:rhamnose utilization protein RhaD (predicted bifunctional aldolase and dehydrogenase)